MALKTADYIDMGARHARGEWNGEAVNPESWQGRAFKAGFDEQAKHLGELQRRRNEMLKASPLHKRIEAERAHWPTGARAHADWLALEATKCLGTPRMARLMRSIDRLYTRHGRSAITA